MGTLAYGTYQTTLSSSGTSDEISVAAGEWCLSLSATTWDSSNAVGVDFIQNGDAAWRALKEPPNNTDAIARTSDGDSIIVKLSDGRLRINAPTIGTTTGLALTVKPASRGAV